MLVNQVKETSPEGAIEKLRSEAYGLIATIAAGETGTGVRKRVRALLAAREGLDEVVKRSEANRRNADEQWRANARDNSRDALRILSVSLETGWPEPAQVAATFADVVARPNENLRDDGLGPETLEALLQQTRFEWSFSPFSFQLVLMWAGTLQVVFHFAENGRPTHVRVYGPAEKPSPRQSRFAVYRRLERRFAMELSEYECRVELRSHDAVVAKLIRRIEEHRDLFTRRCSVSGRFARLTPSRESGALEVFPPLVREGTEAKSETFM